jgi:secreted PhoX family phosphatase
MQARISRRHLIKAGALAAGGAALATVNPRGGGILAEAESPAGPYGDLAADPDGLLDLPPGFRYRVLAMEGDLLPNGMTIPSHPDGMAAFAAGDGSTVLVRNHELVAGDGPPVEGRRPYDRSEPGGTTAIVLDPELRKVDQFVVSSGTRNNCNGGATPWGTWITCEEDRTAGHGYAFEVDFRSPEDRLSRTPIREMGFFSHEALAIDPSTGVVYLTEDDFRGVVDKSDPAGDTRSAFLYRFTPSDRSRRRGALHRGGRLEALALEESRLFNMDFQDPGPHLGIVWRRVDPGEAHADAMRQGCARFNRLEGCHFAGGALWFSDTVGGESRLGQVYRYLPATETLELFVESTDENGLQSPDSVHVAPWGDLLLCEDGRGRDRLIGVTPEGHTYELAANALGAGELVGCCFSPDGRTMFLSIQYPGITFAVQGPFARRDPGRSRRLAWGSPGRLGPRVGDDLVELAKQRGLTVLEVAAYARLGAGLF